MEVRQHRVVGCICRLRDVIWSPARDILLGGFTDRLDEITLAGEGQVRTHAQQGRNRNPLEQRPGVKIDLRHAPMPLAASGLDMRIGHPAASMGGQSSLKGGSQASAPPLRRVIRLTP